MTASPVPMFPLPGVFLFPGQLMPLHVFEPRYRQMIEDVLDGPGRIVLATVLERDRARLAGSPPVLPVAGIGEIARYERLVDGRFMLWVCGLLRVGIEEVDSDRPYRRVRIEPLVDALATPEEEAHLRPIVVTAIRERANASFDSDVDIPLGSLVDVLAQCVAAMPESVMAEIHGECDVAERARKAIAAHERFPKS